MTAEPHSAHIGLIGGLATRAGIFYYQQLQQRYQQDGATLDLTLRHADVATVLAHIGADDRSGLGRYLGGLANELFDGGAELVAVTAIAPHAAIQEIAAVAKGPVVNVLDVVPAVLNTGGAERVAVFGNRAVMESNVYGAIDEASVVRLDPASLEVVHEAYNDIAISGKRGTPSEVELLAGVADRAILEGADAVLLAGTDLSSFYSERSPRYPYLDLARAHLDQIMAEATGRGTSRTSGA